MKLAKTFKKTNITKHTLKCAALLGKNKIVTYILHYEDLFDNQEEEQVYISRIIEEKLRTLPI